MTLNCAALDESLLESNCSATRKGRCPVRIGGGKGVFSKRVGGALFLDEIGDISPLMGAPAARRCGTRGAARRRRPDPCWVISA
ncbi:sigma 54-interacting transcriptional regulator [Shigella flexneri]